GGETAEMPGTYAPGEMDIAGTIVGLVEKDRLLPQSNLKEGDLILGLPSSGLHTNGYSLARAIAKRFDLETPIPALGESLADALLRPHRSYLSVLDPLLVMDPSPVKALAHITGGGFYENIPRILPESLDARIDGASWEIPPIFQFLQREGKVDTEEMRRVFNLGIGMVLITSPEMVETVQEVIGRSTEALGPIPVIGTLERGNGTVRFA
ncbi:MAG: phosphoribosylformylglycinamidine cyclo-ligase, partial [Rectinema sp.]|nr:phosphoribosylformylglycinamidine cyclo-ligase [Rectinema sp.]